MRTAIIQFLLGEHGVMGSSPILTETPPLSSSAVEHVHNEKRI